MHKHLCPLMCAFLTYFQSLAANNLPNFSLKSKKSSELAVAGTLRDKIHALHMHSGEFCCSCDGFYCEENIPRAVRVEAL